MSSKSLQGLIDRANTTLANKLGVSNPAIDALASVIGGANYGQYAHQDQLFAQLNPETCDKEWLYLWAERFKTPRILAEYAFGTINFLNATEVVSVPEGTIVKTADNKEYSVTAATDSDQLVPVTAVISGLDNNLTPGITLTLSMAIQGLNPETITSNEIGGGANIEDLEHWRIRVVNAYSQQQSIGKAEDYKIWAISAHADVDFGFQRDNTPVLGNVTVYIGQNEANPILSDATKQIVQDYIETVRLGGCHVYVQHPTPKVLDITIAGVADANTRTAITETLQTYITNRYETRTGITAGDIVVAITPVTTDFSLISPISSTTPASDEVITLGVITWQ